MLYVPGFHASHPPPFACALLTACKQSNGSYATLTSSQILGVGEIQGRAGEPHDYSSDEDASMVSSELPSEVIWFQAGD